MIVELIEAAVAGIGGIAGILLVAPAQQGGFVPLPTELHVAQDANVEDASFCHSVADLRPKALGGALKRVSSPLASTGELLRWTAAAGDRLQLTLLAEDNGSYRVDLFVAHQSNAPFLKAKLWEMALTRDGETTINLRHEGDRAVLPVRFDHVPLGPGRHILELECFGAGEILIDCIGLHRTGERIIPPTDDGTPGAPGAQRAPGRPFFGVESGGSRAGGVTLSRIVPGSSAAEAGLEAGDVLLSIDSEPTSSWDRVTDAIGRHDPGDVVDIVVLRDGERLETVATLGRSAEGDGSRAAHVIDVLDVQPGQDIADIGCGSGWLSRAIAEAVGADGLVYALEIDESDIRRLRRSSLPNMAPVFSAADDVSLPENSLDTAMLHDVASHVDRSGRPRFYESVARALKADGRLVIFGPHGKARSMLTELRKYRFIPVNADELAALSEDELDKVLWSGIVFRFLP